MIKNINAIKAVDGLGLVLNLKLALNNIKKEKNTFSPFIISSLSMFIIVFIMFSMRVSHSLKKLNNWEIISKMLFFGLVTVILFSIIFLFYSYNFLLNERSREYSIYNVLGFKKSNIILVAFYEILICLLIITGVGLIVGIAIAKFLFLIFVNVIGESYYNLEINPLAIIFVIETFFLIFTILFSLGALKILKTSPKELLTKTSKGEREPKGKIILTISSLMLLISGYYLALTVDNPVNALTKFFIAVLLVIFGTYLFYIAVTISYLKMKKKMRSYYTSHNFISTNLLLYRMKANAIGLANITILLTMSLVTLIVTTGLFIGSKQVILDNFPQEAQVRQNVIHKNDSRLGLNKIIEDTSNKSGVKVSNLNTIRQISYDFIGRSRKNNSIDFNGVYLNLLGKNIMSVVMVTAEDIQKLGNHIEILKSLKKNEILMTDFSGNTKNIEYIGWYGQKYKVVGHLNKIANLPKQPSISETSLLIFSDDNSMNQAISAINKTYDKEGLSTDSSPYFLSLFDISPKKVYQFKKYLSQQDKGLELDDRKSSLKEVVVEIGGILFIGFILSFSFIIGVAMITYYKQLSEGIQDKKTFKILQDIGLTKVEVKKTISKQVRMMFIIPIAMMVINFLFSYNMISKIIELFGITDSEIIGIVSLLVVLTVILFYYLTYKITNLVYFKTVENKSKQDVGLIIS
ncbi:FtsX-like permease family protein [Lactococcus lactis]|uniref:FtsX-like permease family protein n=2 Tax=Lactococcus lactis TaxID=1358 RepID=UPI0011BB9C25|nr:ABC transporter permease [Lactococcus lactis]QEA59953.1 ABC transporter permease [Lactococcus lactis]WKG35560.1 ABC transporter permease [Lactococcus lactis subsp. lactis]